MLGYQSNDGLRERIFRFVAKDEVEGLLKKLETIVEEVDAIGTPTMRPIAASNYSLTTAVQHVLGGKINAAVVRGNPIRLDNINLNVEDMLRQKRADPKRRRNVRVKYPDTLSVDESASA